jgi:hypothetical protein
VLGLVTRGKKTVFKFARKIPVISQRIEHEMKKVNEMFEQDVIHRNEGNPYITTLPNEGKSHHDIIQQVEQYLSFGKCRVRFLYVCMYVRGETGRSLQLQ